MYESFELFGHGWESNGGVNFNHDVDFLFFSLVKKAVFLLC